MENLDQDLLEYVRDEFRAPDLNAETPLLEGIVDSLGVFRVVNFVEAQFGVRLEDRELTAEVFRNVNSLAAYVREKAKAA